MTLPLRLVMIRQCRLRTLPRHLMVTAVLLLGSTALADVAPAVVRAESAAADPSADPAAVARPAVPTPLPFIIGDDPLADDAQQALLSWSSFILNNDRRSFARFVQLRDSVAGAAALQLELDPKVVQEAWANADSTHQLALLSAFTQLGVPYVRYTMRPGIAFDCSGLTSYAWGQVGHSMVRQSLRQITAVQRVAREQAQAGDLVWYPGHIMLYLGVDDAVIHAPLSGRNVELGFIAARRSRWVRFGNPVGAA
jgi:cell wall-associated NlpC family hydrolase